MRKDNAECAPVRSVQVRVRHCRGGAADALRARVRAECILRGTGRAFVFQRFSERLTACATPKPGPRRIPMRRPACLRVLKSCRSNGCSAKGSPPHEALCHPLLGDFASAGLCRGGTIPRREGCSTTPKAIRHRSLCVDSLCCGMVSSPNTYRMTKRPLEVRMGCSPDFRTYLCSQRRF